MTTRDENLLAPMADAAREAGALLAAMARPAPVTTHAELREAYDAIEAPAAAVIRRRLAELRPDAMWTDELDTLAPVPRTGEAWVVDVIDGAVQFLQDLPQYCVSLALVRDGEPVAAVLHAPGPGQTYTAAAGCGATRDGTRVRPSRKGDPALAVVATSQPPFLDRQPVVAAAAGRSLSSVLPAVAAVRNLGPTSWQIADVAAGRLDAFWQFGRDDTNVLPGALVAREAGALVTDADGRPWRPGAGSVLVAPPQLHGAFLGLLAAAR